MKFNNLFKLVIAIAVSELVGVMGSFFTVSAIPNWYAGLVKPVLDPPAWIFGPVWTMLYALMGVAFFLVWKQRPYILENIRMLRVWRIGVVAFFVQLFLNAIWSVIFFGSTSLTINGLNNIGIAFVDIILLWLAIVWTMLIFYKISKPAAYLFVPYLLWASFASHLNYSIWQLNFSANLEQPACTQEAKQCSDGSYVGRAGIKCEFLACPKENLIRVFLPRANEEITSPFLVSGEARGNWFFEASFPVKLLDENGQLIAQAPAQARGEWMTIDFVPFEVKIIFPKVSSQKGTLVLEKDNPSGLPENADELRIPILFSSGTTQTKETR